MNRAEQIAHHRDELKRLEAEEKADRPALAAGQVWRHPEFGFILVEDQPPSDHGEFIVFNIFGKIPMFSGIVSIEPEWTFVGLARDVLRVVNPEDNTYHLDIINAPIRPPS